MTESTEDLADQIDHALRTDRLSLRRRLRGIRRAAAEGRPYDRNLHRLQRDLRKSVRTRAKRAERLPRPTLPDDLPIAEKRDEIVRALEEHQVVVVCGDTGSGKSTQLPKLCLEMGLGVDGWIGHTQPRRIAARSIASRLAEELGSPLGKDVGYKVRFDDTTRAENHVKLMTDGILLAETQGDRFLDQYDAILVDEAHERSLNIEFLLGYLKRLLPKRPDLKVIITSATIDPQRFADHFADTNGRAPVVEVSGRSYPVEVRYRPPEETEDSDDAYRPVLAAIDEAAAEVSGDILVFMPTERDINETAKALRRHRIPGDAPGRQTEVLPLYARLSPSEQSRVFHPPRWRRIVIATNVAESSLTVPGVRAVVDTGTARISRFSARAGVQRLPVEPISQAAADQRKGRCGRVGPGLCIRLYGEDDYARRDAYTTPEILRTSLASVILQMAALKLGRVEDFPFMDPPRPRMVRHGYKTLYELHAVDDENKLTETGRTLSRLPVDPRIGRMILAADGEHTLTEMLVVAAALECRDPRQRPVDNPHPADEAHARFTHPESDFLSHLKLWDFYHDLKVKLSRNQLRKACRQNYLDPNRMREWTDIHRQLVDLVQDAGMRRHARRDDYDAIHRALLAGLLANVAHRSGTYEYTGAGGKKLQLWPGSGLFRKPPKWIVSAEQVETSKRFARTAARIQPGWIEPIAPHLLRRSYSEPVWERESGRVVASEKVSLFGLPVVPARRVDYARVDPEQARTMFIHHALVEGDYDTDATFFHHNQKLVDEVRAMEAKARRPDFLADEEVRFAFYDRRIPRDVASGPAFEKWRKRAEKEDPSLLQMRREDLVKPAAEAPSAEAFPDTLRVGHAEVPLTYQLAPGTEEDGITLTVPLEGLNQLDPGQLGWLVPGLLKEKVAAVIRGMPKPIRRHLSPAPDTAEKVVPELRFGEGGFPEALAGAIERARGIRVPPDAIREDHLPEHLRFKIQVVDEEGQPLAAGRDVGELRRSLGAEAGERFSEVSAHQWKRSGITAWDFGELPESVEISRGSGSMTGFPALVDEGSAAGLELFESPDAAAARTREGVRRLFILQNDRELRFHISDAASGTLHWQSALFGDPEAFEDDLMHMIADRLLFSRQGLIRDPAEFERRSAAARDALRPVTQQAVNLVRRILDTYRDARLAIDENRRLEWRHAVEQIETQLAHLVAPRFLRRVPWAWLGQYPRYFRGVRTRFDKLAGGKLSRDKERATAFEKWWRAYLAAVGDDDAVSPAAEPLRSLRWMLEEYRVALFAEEVGTAIKISEKRLQRQWRQAAG